MLLLFIKGSNKPFTNYSNKIFEKLTYNRLHTYVEQHNILSEQQHRFRSVLSTSLAIYDTQHMKTFCKIQRKVLLPLALYCVVCLRQGLKNTAAHSRPATKNLCANV